MAERQDTRVGPIGLAGGAVLIVLGAYFLLSNAGLLLAVSWSQLWPVVLIAVGSAVVLGSLRREAPGSLLVARDGAARLDVQLDVGGGEVRLAGGATELLEVGTTRGAPLLDVDRSGDTARVRIRPRGGWWSWSGPTDWTIGVAPDRPVRLTVNGGAGRFNLDLRQVALAEARISIGAASLSLFLPRPRGEVPIHVSTGASAVDVEVPSGVEARVTASGGLVTRSGPSETPGYATASDRVTVTISGGATAVTVR